MTLDVQVPLVVYDGDGTTSAFGVEDSDGNAIVYKSNAEIKVEEFVKATETSVTLLEGVDYDLAAGVVTRSAGALPTTKQLVIRRVTTLDQPTAFGTSSSFSGATHTAVADRHRRIDQELKEELGRALRANLIGTAYEAGNRRIEAVADPVSAQDAVTKAYGDANFGGAAATAAAASADAAEASAAQAAGLAASSIIDPSFSYTWSTATSPPPGAGNASGNNATLGSITTLYLSSLPSEGDITGYLSAALAAISGTTIYTTVTKTGDASKFFVFRVSSATAQSGYTSLAGVVVANSGTLSNGDSLTVTLRRVTDSQALKFSAYRALYPNDMDAFKAALTDLYSVSSGYRILDGEGATLSMTDEIDVAAVTGVTSISSWHMITGFNFVAANDFASATIVATCSNASGKIVTMADTSQIERGMYVAGSNCSRGTYVVSVDSPTQITLNVNPWATFTSESLSFTKHKYFLNYRGFSYLANLTMFACQFDCAGYASGIMLADDGIACYFDLVRFTLVKDRALTDWHGSGSGLSLTACDITFSGATATTGHGVTITQNDTKIRNCRITTAKHQIICHGSGFLLVGSHIWGGDGYGIVLTRRVYKIAITGNYIDNLWILLSDETANSATASDYIGNIVIVGNIFTSTAAPDATWAWIKAEPHVASRYIAEITVTGNVFKDQANGAVPYKVEGTITTYGSLDLENHTNVNFENNAFDGVNKSTLSKRHVFFTQATASSTWSIDFSNYLPFGGYPQSVLSIVPHALKDGSDVAAYAAFYVNNGSELTTNKDRVQIRWGNGSTAFAVKGDVHLVVSNNVGLASA